MAKGYPMEAVMGAASSTPLAGPISDTATHTLGPFDPQLGRLIWATLVATGASGTVQLLRSTDGGATMNALTIGGQVLGIWTLAGANGVIVNEQLISETDAAATYYLVIKLTAGSVVYRIAQ